MSTKAPNVSGVNSHLDNERSQSTLGHFSRFYEVKGEEQSKHREQNATSMVGSFYDLVTDFYEYGYGEAFHFAPIYDNMSMTANLQQYEVEIAKTLKAQPGKTILDLGCGVGGPARVIGKFSGANIIGVNINDYQIKRAKLLTAAANLQDTITYEKADFCNLEQFEDNSMDGAYALEAICHSSDPLLVYKEVYRVLKPGSLFVDSAWVLTDKYQREDPHHQKIKQDIEYGNSLPDLRTSETTLNKVKESGLEVIEAKNCDVEGDLPWDIFLRGKSCLSMQSFRTSWLGRCFTHYSLSALETVRLVPTGTTKVHSFLLTGADGLVASRKAGIFTPVFRIVAKKPLN